MPKMNRREFFKKGAATVFVLSVPTILPRCAKKKSITELARVNTKVAAVRGNNLKTMTRDAIDTIGGIGKFVNPGETVFIKPNMVTLPWGNSRNRFLNGECSKVEIIVATAEECLKAGAAEVIIGDGSQMPSFDWTYATTLDGSTDLVQEVQRLNSTYYRKVSLVCLEINSSEWVEIPSQSNLCKIVISGLVANADKVISIPVAKTHAWAQLTLSIKNFMGIPSLKKYGQQYPDGHWDRSKKMDHTNPQVLAQYSLDIVSGIKPDLAIIDFSIGLEGDGPTLDMGNANTVDMKKRLGSWLILASSDLIAADATAARVMNHNITEIKQLVMGYEMGLGEINEKSIEIVGEKLNDLRVEWRQSKLRKY